MFEQNLINDKIQGEIRSLVGELYAKCLDPKYEFKDADSIRDVLAACCNVQGLKISFDPGGCVEQGKTSIDAVEQAVLHLYPDGFKKEIPGKEEFVGIKFVSRDGVPPVPDAIAKQQSIMNDEIKERAINGEILKGGVEEYMKKDGARGGMVLDTANTPEAVSEMQKSFIYRVEHITGMIVNRLIESIKESKNSVGESKTIFLDDYMIKISVWSRDKFPARRKDL